MSNPIYVTRPFIPPFEEYTELLKGPWSTGIFTHNGPLVQRLEKELCEKLSIQNLVAVSNGTIALQMAIRALDLKGEIITSPFSWIATCSSIMWEYCTPKFVDIDPDTYNIDPERIAAAITPDTCAIMPVHTFGSPCDVHRIAEVAQQHNLKVIYDAAHAVGSTVDGNSVLEFGDISATSFHATKLFQTGEGGGCIATDPDLHKRLQRLRFFGHNDQKEIVETGFNGKMTEIHAGIGVAMIPYLEEVLAQRAEKAALYRQHLESCECLSFQKVKHGESNESYFSVLFDTEPRLEAALAALTAENIFPRRYFHPSLNNIKLLNGGSCPISESIASRILCLPHYYGVDEDLVEKISSIVVGAVS